MQNDNKLRTIRRLYMWSSGSAEITKAVSGFCTPYCQDLQIVTSFSRPENVRYFSANVQHLLHRCSTHLTAFDTAVFSYSLIWEQLVLLMPRIPTSIISKAHKENALLPLLLKECRSLDLARNELRWMRARVLENNSPTSKGKDTGPGHIPGWRNRLRSMCRTRSRGMPLQYILGDQPFGDLEILCRRGVLIPRSGKLF